MSSCPHCGKTISFGPTSDARVSLGCGTLILIAIIVAIFSNGNTDEIRDLRREIRSLEKKIDESLAALPVEAQVEGD